MKKLDRREVVLYSAAVGHRRRSVSSSYVHRTSSKVQSVNRNQKVVIVAATYNEKFTTPLLENCLEELEENAPFLEVEVLRVPGAFEVPVMVKRAIASPSGQVPNVIIGLGVILRGSTAHADLIGAAITNQLLSIACVTLTPVIHEVLLLSDEKQAFSRCVASSLNRGREAARAAMSMLNLVEEQDSAALRARRIAAASNGSLF